MQLSLLGRRKVAFLFLLGVAIPSLALAYLAFRGIRNEQALLERRRLEEHRAISRLVNDTIQRHISGVESAFSQLIPDQRDSLDSDLSSSLEVLNEELPLVEAVFVLRDPDTIQLPTAGLLFLLDGRLQPRPQDMDRLRRRW